MTDRKKIEKATIEELRAFAQDIFNIELDARSTVQSIIQKLRAVGYEKDDIPVGLSGGSRETANSDGPSPYKVEKMRHADINKNTSQKERKFFGILIEAHDGDGGKDPVSVSVNGRALSLPRGVGVAVPEEYVEVLQNAQQKIYDTNENIGPDNPGGLSTFRWVKSYPFHFVPDSQVQMVVNQAKEAA